VIATIELQVSKDASGQPKTDKTTGEPEPPRAQVKLFSYKPVMGQPVATTTTNVSSPTTNAAPAVATPAPARPAPTPDRLAQLASQL
jgi:hypothetical protein